MESVVMIRGAPLARGEIACLLGTKGTNYVEQGIFLILIAFIQSLQECRPVNESKAA
jgi:hypothetical protein